MLKWNNASAGLGRRAPSEQADPPIDTAVSPVLYYEMTDKEFLEQFQMIIKGMGDMEARLNQKIEHAVSESEARTRIYIENEVGRRIDSLFDGYKLAPEEQ